MSTLEGELLDKIKKRIAAGLASDDKPIKERWDGKLVKIPDYLVESLQVLVEGEDVLNGNFEVLIYSDYKNEIADIEKEMNRQVFAPSPSDLSFLRKELVKIIENGID